MDTNKKDGGRLDAALAEIQSDLARLKELTASLERLLMAEDADHADAVRRERVESHAEWLQAESLDFDLEVTRVLLGRRAKDDLN